MDGCGSPKSYEMKILILSVLLVVNSYSQDSIKISSVLDTICAERGHVLAGIAFITAVNCPPYFIDTDSTTVVVYPSCNTIQYNCERCGKKIIEAEKEIKKTIWKLIKQ